MKLIVAIVGREQLGCVWAAVETLGPEWMLVSEVLVNAKDEAHPLIYRAATIRVSMVPRVKLEIAIRDDAVDEAVDAIACMAFAGAADPAGSSRLLVRPLHDATPPRVRADDLAASVSVVG